jgi:hypothetical protein
MNQKKWIIGIGSIAVVVLVVTAVAMLSSSNRQVAKVGPDIKATTTEDNNGVDAGDVLGSKDAHKTGVKSAKTADGKKVLMHDHGALPAIPGNANPQVKAVVEAVRDKNHPERLSVLASPKPFDAAAYKNNPSVYLETTEPGRVFQTAQPGEGVPVLKRVSADYSRVTQGESVLLRVKAKPGDPISYTTFDCGAFDNGLTSITVKADDKGVAVAKLTTTPGVYKDIHILAGSPMAASQVRFVVNVSLPETVAKSGSTTSPKTK